MDHQSSEDEEQSTTDEGQDSGRYLYRVCSRDEDPAQGLEARDPTAIDVTPSSHVHGKRASPFISTTSTYEAMQMYYGLALNNRRRRPGRIVRIDRERLSRVRGIQIIDLGDPEVADREFSLKDWRGKNYASKYKEVLVKGKIPADCIEVLDDVEESDSFDVEDYSSEDGEEESSNQSEGTQDKNPRGKDGDASSDDDREDDHSSERTKRRKQNDEDEEGTTQRFEILSEEFRETLRSFITRREETIRMLKELVKLLNACRKNANITKITGAGVSIVGAGAALVSIPLTGGLSVLALAAGGILGVAGGVTGISGDVYGNNRESDLMREAEQILRDDQAEAERLARAGTALQSHMKFMNSIGLFAKGGMAVAAIARGNEFIMRILSLSSKASKAVGIARIAKGTSAVLSVVFVPIDVWQIVSSSQELSQDNSEKAQQVNNIIEELEADLRERRDLLG